MKVPEIFLPEKKLDNKVEELMTEKSLKKPQISKNEIPRYAVQENGDYLVMRGGTIIGTHDCKSIISVTFYFTTDGEEHKLHRGTKEKNWLDENRINLEGSLVSKLLSLGLIASREPDRRLSSLYPSTFPRDDWELEMKHATEQAYKELVKLATQ